MKTQAASPNMGHIFICRTGSLGGAIRPTIELDGEPIAVIGRGTYSFTEIKPGDHTLVAKTPEHDSKLPFSIAAGEQKYFQTWVSVGFVVGWGLIDTMPTADGKKCVNESELVEPESSAKK